MISNESDNDENSPPRKLRKIHYDQKYSKFWEKEPEYAGWIKPSTKGNKFFQCTACNCDLKCSGGKYIINKHARSAKHINSVKGLFILIFLSGLLIIKITSLFVSLLSTCSITILFFHF